MSDETDKENKCAEIDCWHYRADGIIYCKCCFVGKCRTIPGHRMNDSPTAMVHISMYKTVEAQLKIALGELAIVKKERDSAVGHSTLKEGWLKLKDKLITKHKYRADLYEVALLDIQEVLKKIEWAENGRCPKCKMFDHYGHMGNCILGRAVKVVLEREKVKAFETK